MRVVFCAQFKMHFSLIYQYNCVATLISDSERLASKQTSAGQVHHTGRRLCVRLQRPEVLRIGSQIGTRQLHGVRAAAVQALRRHHLVTIFSSYLVFNKNTILNGPSGFFDTVFFVHKEIFYNLLTNGSKNELFFFFSFVS